MPPKQIVIDSGHPASLARFWAALLDGDCLEMCFQQISDRAEGEHSTLLDLVTSDRGSAIAQAVTLGASLAEEHPHHTWLRDPEGNDFCIVER